MRVFRLDRTGEETQALPQDGQGTPVFVVATQQEFKEIGSELGISQHPQMKYNNHDENIRFETYDNYDFLSFVYFETKDNEFDFETLNIYYSKTFLALVTQEGNTLHQDMLDMFIKDNIARKPAFSGLEFLYYKLLEIAFTNMFEEMCQYESILSDMENDIAQDRQRYDFEKIVGIKSNCFEVKKCMRLLLYVGDQLAANDNQLIEEKSMRFFRNLEMRINRMYEFAANIHEMSEHLMELYNSTVTSATNDLINKLTIFTVFATPLTLLTGLYGMNFVNMPELQHPYGYFILLGIMVGIIVTTFLILKKIKLL